MTFSLQDISLRGNPAYEQDSKVQFVIDAVYAFAYSLQKLKEDVCPRHRGIWLARTSATLPQSRGSPETAGLNKSWVDS